MAVPKPGYCLTEILTRFQLPVVIQCCGFQSTGISRGNFNIDYFQKMLLYDKRQCKKVIAHNFTTSTGHELEFGHQFLLPKDYKGWFAVLNLKDEPVPHFRNVEELSKSCCHTFLVGGHEPVEAVQKQKGRTLVTSRTLYPGDILKKGNVYLANTKVRSSFRSKTKQDSFLLCIDDNDIEIHLPLRNKGTFYVLRNKNPNTKPSVPIMQIKDILTSLTLPCHVKLVFGRHPSTPCSFTGSLLLSDTYEESSVILAPINNPRNILMELPVDNPMRFRVAITDSKLQSQNWYKRAILLCEEQAETFMRNIKVSADRFFTDTGDDAKTTEDSVRPASYPNTPTTPKPLSRVFKPSSRAQLPPPPPIVRLNQPPEMWHREGPVQDGERQQYVTMEMWHREEPVQDGERQQYVTMDRPRPQSDDSTLLSLSSPNRSCGPEKGDLMATIDSYLSLHVYQPQPHEPDKGSQISTVDSYLSKPIYPTQSHGPETGNQMSTVDSSYLSLPIYPPQSQQEQHQPESENATVTECGISVTPNRRGLTNIGRSNSMYDSIGSEQFNVCEYDSADSGYTEVGTPCLQWHFQPPGGDVTFNSSQLSLLDLSLDNVSGSSDNLTQHVEFGNSF